MALINTEKTSKLQNFYPINIGNCSDF